MKTLPISISTPVFAYLLLISSIGAADGQTADRTSARTKKMIQVRASRFGITEPVRKLAADRQLSGSKTASESHAQRIGPLHPIWNPSSSTASKISKARTVYSAPQTFLGTMEPPIRTFEGISMSDNADVFMFSYVPSDSNGDIGPNHYVEMVNSLYRVYDRQGTPLTPALKLSSLFQVLGGPASEWDNGDPIVQYDHLADRWLLSQFVVEQWFDGELAHQAIAISKTADPTGEYFVYDFEMPNEYLNDYPKFGVWSQAYFMTDNEFSWEGPAVGAGVFAFDRMKMLAGDPSASYVYHSMPGTFGVLPADLDGRPPAIGSPGLFVGLTSPELAYYQPIEEDLAASNVGSASQQYGLEIFTFRVDFDRPELSEFSTYGFVSLPPFTLFTTNMDAVTQRGTKSKLDTLGDRLMYRLQYRCYEGQDSLVGNFTENVDGSGQAGVHYFELRRYLPGGDFFIHEQGLQAPDHLHRWMASAATDWQGNLAVGYSASGIDTYPSIRYAGRLANHPPGSLTLKEAVMCEGQNYQEYGRWGDYTMIALDPVDDSTFWYVNQYLATNANSWKTRIGSFRFTNSAPAPQASVLFVIKEAGTGDPVHSTTIQSSNGYWRRMDSTNACLIRYLPPGSYSFRFKADGFKELHGAQVLLTNQQHLVQEIELQRDQKPFDFVISSRQPIEIAGKWRGPFDPAPAPLTVSNMGLSSLVWTSYWNHGWFEATPSGGILGSSACDTVTFRATRLAEQLPPGSYSDTLVLACLNNSQYYAIPIRLEIDVAAAKIGFKEGCLSVAKTEPHVDVEVIRTQNTNSVAWVEYATTTNGSAIADADFQTAKGVLFFPEGVTRQTIRIELLPVTNAPSKSFLLTLYNPQGNASLGDLDTMTIHLLENRNLVYRELLDSEPNWEMNDGWEYGQSSITTLTGSNMFGFPLTDTSYPNDLLQPACLTSQAIDCSAFTNLKLHFYRRLAIERSVSDHAAVEISTNKEDWVVLWSNPADKYIWDWTWTPVSYDLPSIANRCSTVYIRWRFGPTDSSVNYSGWKLDDIELFGDPYPPLLTTLPVLTNLWEIQHLRIVDKDTNSLILNANARYIEDIQPLFPEIKSLADLLGKSDYYFYPSNLADKYRADDRSVMEGGKFWETIEENQPQGGVISYVYVSKIPLFDGQGNVFGLRICWYPIPAPDLTQLPLFTNSWVAAHAIVIDKDTNSVFINANDAFLNTLRPIFPGIKSVTNLIGRDDYSFYPTLMADKFRADDQRVLQSGSTWTAVEANQPLGGQITFNHVTKSPLRNASNEIVGLRIVAFALPVLNAEGDRSNLKLSWPSDFAPFVLQYSENIGLEWKNFEGLPVTTNGFIRAVVTNQSDRIFYRLKMEVGGW